MQQITVELPEAVVERATASAAADFRTLSGLVAAALAAYCDGLDLQAMKRSQALGAPRQVQYVGVKERKRQEMARKMQECAAAGAHQWRVLFGDVVCSHCETVGTREDMGLPPAVEFHKPTREEIDEMNRQARADRAAKDKVILAERDARLLAQGKVPS